MTNQDRRFRSRRYARALGRRTAVGFGFDRPGARWPGGAVHWYDVVVSLSLLDLD